MAYCGYDPDKNIPDLSGKVILLTGGTGGIGKATILELAKHSPGHIYFTGRNQQAADEIITTVGANITFLPCDHGDLESVHRAADLFTSTRLDVFIANAGIMVVPPSLTKDGFEIQFGTNHIGNMALLFRLLPVMLSTAKLPGADVRYVALTSTGFRGHPWHGIDFNSLRSAQENLLMGGWGRYAQSKLANILGARELGKRYPEITSVAVHPGIVRTDLVTTLGFWNRALVFMLRPWPWGPLTPRQGCYNTLWAATGPDVKEKMGKGKVAFFEPVGSANSGDGMCWNDELMKTLWEWTEKVTNREG
ncbi:putative oxidoreductase [Cladobotryum mycophilum]|uniref:Oxidoreductase n=1 Tax=Cladobotryum mycophilum TaxID=491253 RepID=A0ABR0S9K9_9HYPO